MSATIATAALGAAGLAVFALGRYLEQYHNRQMVQHHERIATAYEDDDPEAAHAEFQRMQNNQWFDYAQDGFMPCYFAGTALIMLAVMRLWGVP